MQPNRTERRELLGDTSQRELSGMRLCVLAANKAGRRATVLLSIALVFAVTSAIFAASPASLSTVLLLATALALAVAVQVASPGFRARLRSMRVAAGPVLPDPMNFRDAHVLGLVQRLARAREARKDSITRSPYGRCHALSRSESGIAAVERRAIVVAARAEYVSSFLADLSECGVQLESNIVRLRSNEQDAACVEASTAYGKAAAWTADRRASVRHLEERRAALVATLEHLIAVLESMPAKLTDLELRRVEATDDLLGADTADVEDELAQVGAVEDPMRASADIQATPGGVLSRAPY